MNTTVVPVTNADAEQGVPNARSTISGELLRLDSEMRGVDRRIFFDPDIYELEFDRIWSKVWVYVAHESQIPKPKDFLTTWIGRVPVIVSRDRKGTVHAFVNVCTHRGATLCRTEKGNAGTFVCPFHGWAFSDQGELLAMNEEESGGYPAGFDKSKRGLTRVRCESYKGFLFATLNPEAEPLEDYLAEAKPFIDTFAEQSPQGIEVLKGRFIYNYEGNWKLQGENGVDGYHVPMVHANYVQMVAHRMQANAGEKTVKTIDAGKFGKLGGGYYDLRNGHTLLWTNIPNPQDRPLYVAHEELAARLGKLKAEWAMDRSRNLLIYPNLLLMDQASSQIRVFRPLAVNRTEVTAYCFAPVGEPAAERNKRIRQYEDFFNASGMATPDDLNEFNETQKGFGAYGLQRWSDISRGEAHEIPGPDAAASELGIQPGSSGPDAADEGIFVAQHERWLQLMQAGTEASL
ncbi:Rieske 2Fe-2S domain-containing protein [Pseudoxanthomonas spadix]|uniref:Rieske 2Fe-2S domain-containing protein n=1 Tax=Pseudoxanthomonas spadix TaxID=415229 RepID=UPI000EFED2CA|nr:Rieske 2Fe-2S domain-containing protein [Pseudoxanthomonas spadix]MBP3975202.1 Rieske 2Fe-2S domain-containing protein [Pseudoxanthomonas spadix]RMW98304.1 benzoate 1,2-dioxygenase large subunit [Pseudoxanthomonas spadix]